MDDFPEPEAPTKATDYPLYIFKFIPFSTLTEGFDGYEKIPSLNSTTTFSSTKFAFFSPLFILTGSSII